MLIFPRYELYLRLADWGHTEMKRLILVAAAGVLAFAVGAIPAKADGIDFLGTGGSMSFIPSLGNVFNASATIGTVNRLISPSTTFPVTSGLLSLTSGAATCVFTSPSCTSFVMFGPGGSLTLTGGIPTFGIADGTNLVAGSFLSGALFSFGGGVGSFSGGVSITSINASLLTSMFPGLSLPPSIGPGTVAQVFFSWDQTTGAGTIGSTNFLFTVPEPSTLVLLGSLMVAAAVLFRWKLSAGRR